MNLSPKEKLLYLAAVPLLAAGMSAVATKLVQEPTQQVIVLPVLETKDGLGKEALTAAARQAVEEAGQSEPSEWPHAMVFITIVLGLFAYWGFVIWIASRG